MCNYPIIAFVICAKMCINFEGLLDSAVIAKHHFLAQYSYGLF